MAFQFRMVLMAANAPESEDVELDPFTEARAKTAELMSQHG